MVMVEDINLSVVVEYGWRWLLEGQMMIDIWLDGGTWRYL